MAVSIVKARKLIGKTYKKMSDPEVQDLVNQFYGLAEIIASVVSGSNRPHMGVEPPMDKEENGVS